MILVLPLGNRFAMIQSKMGLASILSKFDISLSKRTQYPAVFDPKQFIVTAVGGIWLKVEARNEE
jgi:cytochrome P450 family 6